MNFKPKSKTKKDTTFYAVDMAQLALNNDPNDIFYGVWSQNNIYAPIITTYTNTQLILNGTSKQTYYIIAKRKNDTELKAHKIKKINEIIEQNDIVLLKGNKFYLSNDKQILNNIIKEKYKHKLQIARQTITNLNKGYFDNVLRRDSFYDKLYKERAILQPSTINKSYKYTLNMLKQA